LGKNGENRSSRLKPGQELADHIRKGNGGEGFPAAGRGIGKELWAFMTGL